MFKQVRNLLVGALGALLIRTIAFTLRIHVDDRSGLLADPGHPTPIIFAFWHNRLFLMPFLYRRFLPQRQAVCLVSASQDGEMIARVLRQFGLAAARGSSSRRGKEAFRELAGHLKEGWDVAITPDGPRGPRYRAHDGVVSLAALSGSPLIPVTYSLEWKITLPTWDGFMIPLPFSRCHLHLGKAMIFSSPSEGDALETGRFDLEKNLSMSD